MALRTRAHVAPSGWLGLASLVAAGALAFGYAALDGCAAGNEKSTAGTGGVAWSTSASGGNAGSGGASSSTGVGGVGGASVTATGGLGGATSTATVSSGSGGAGGEGGAGGGAAGGSVLLFGGGPAGLFGARAAGGSWTPTTIAGATSHGVGLALRSDGIGVGVFRSAADASLSYLLHDKFVWQSPVAIAMNVTTRAAPAIASGASAQVLFHGDDYKHYFASYGAGWSPLAEPVMPAAEAQSFGPEPGRIAMTNGHPVIAFAGDDGGVYVQERVGGAWQTAAKVAGSNTLLAPALAALGGSNELAVVYVRASDKKLMYALRTGGLWSVPLEVEAASFADSAPALLGRADGSAVLAFRGLDQKGYAATFTPGQMPPFSQPGPIASPNFVLAATPALALGVDGHGAELACVQASDGVAYAMHLTGGTWAGQVAVGGAQLTSVAIASAP